MWMSLLDLLAGILPKHGETIGVYFKILLVATLIAVVIRFILNGILCPEAEEEDLGA